MILQVPRHFQYKGLPKNKCVCTDIRGDQIKQKVGVLVVGAWIQGVSKVEYWIDFLESNFHLSKNIF